MRLRIPEKLETERLVLRQFTVEDHPDLHVYYGDETCMRYTVGHAMTDWESWRAMATMVGHWQLRGYGPYAVEEKTTRRVAGPIGLWFPHEWPEPEIKWGMARRFWGKGYASEAARAVREMAASHLPELHLISLIDPENQGSINVARAVGARREGDFELRGRTCHLYRHRRP